MPDGPTTPYRSPQRRDKRRTFYWADNNRNTVTKKKCPFSPFGDVEILAVTDLISAQPLFDRMRNKKKIYRHTGKAPGIAPEGSRILESAQSCHPARQGQLMSRIFLRLPNH